MVNVDPFIYFTHHWNQLVKIWLTVALAVERYISVKFPFKVSVLLSAKNAWILCGFITVASGVFAIPFALEYHPIRNDKVPINDSCNAFQLCRLLNFYYLLTNDHLTNDHLTR